MIDINYGDTVCIVKPNDLFYQSKGIVLGKNPKGQWRIDLNYIIKDYRDFDLEKKPIGLKNDEK